MPPVPHCALLLKKPDSVVSHGLKRPHRCPRASHRTPQCSVCRTLVLLPLPSRPPSPTSTYLWRSPSKHPAPLGHLRIWPHQVLVFPLPGHSAPGHTSLLPPGPLPTTSGPRPPPSPYDIWSCCSLASNPRPLHSNSGRLPPSNAISLSTSQAPGRPD